MSTIIFPKCYHLPPPLAGSKTSFDLVMIDSETPALDKLEAFLIKFADLIRSLPVMLQAPNMGTNSSMTRILFIIGRSLRSNSGEQPYQHPYHLGTC